MSRALVIRSRFWRAVLWHASIALVLGVLAALLGCASPAGEPAPPPPSAAP